MTTQAHHPGGDRLDRPLDRRCRARAIAGRFEVEAVVGGRDARGAGRRRAAAWRALRRAGDDARCGPSSRSELSGSGIACGAGAGAVLEAARATRTWSWRDQRRRRPRADLRALSSRAPIALANKESLVCAGAAFMRDAPAARRRDPAGRFASTTRSSRRSAAGRSRTGRAMTLTASGGPFRTWTPSRSPPRRPAQALAHPSLVDGRKITINSATLMNKGLELIEAHHLFGLPPIGSMCSSIRNRSSTASSLRATAPSRRGSPCRT